jgi:hypothetical protein
MYRVTYLFAVGMIAAATLLAQAPPSSAPQAPASPAGTYQPKYPGDKAHSNSEAAALGYIRTVLTAQKLHKKKHDSYATSLSSLVGSGSFTKRMVSPDRGDYKVSFHGAKEKFGLTLVPKQFDAERRSFFADETGTIRAEDDKPATASSPLLK